MVFQNWPAKMVAPTDPARITLHIPLKNQKREKCPCRVVVVLLAVVLVVMMVWECNNPDQRTFRTVRPSFAFDRKRHRHPTDYRITQTSVCDTLPTIRRRRRQRQRPMSPQKTLLHFQRLSKPTMTTTMAIVDITTTKDSSTSATRNTTPTLSTAMTTGIDTTVTAATTHPSNVV
jgi:hypothetical protein